MVNNFMEYSLGLCGVDHVSGAELYFFSATVPASEGVESRRKLELPTRQEKQR
jgi:hypothetical protein